MAVKLQRFRLVLLSLLVAIAVGVPGAHGESVPTAKSIYARDNLVAWCIVPFDSKNRTPVQRAEMLKQLGFKRYAYDWRAQHLPTFEAEIAELKSRGLIA